METFNFHLTMIHKQVTIREELLVALITNLIVKQEKTPIQENLKLLMGQYSMET
jgi:hypothetical protein